MKDKIQAEVFRDGAATFVVLDGASVPGLLDKLAEWQPAYECLYRGEIEPDLAQVAPYLAQMEPDSDFAEWVLEEGWGKHWGIFAIADAGLRDMRQHFRRFITVHDESGKPLRFRYYDPRVLRTFLPTCNEEEVAEFFGPVQCYIAEGEEPDVALRFELKEGKLAVEESK